MEHLRRPRDVRERIRRQRRGAQAFDEKIRSLAKRSHLFTREKLRRPGSIDVSLLFADTAVSVQTAKEMLASLALEDGQAADGATAYRLSTSDTTGRALAHLRHPLGRYETWPRSTKKARPSSAESAENSDGAEVVRTTGRRAPLSLPDRFLESFTRESAVRDPFGLSGRNIEDAAFYNFDYYQVFSFETAKQDPDPDPDPDPVVIPGDPGTPAGSGDIGSLPYDLVKVPGAPAFLKDLDPQIDEDGVLLLDEVFRHYVQAALDNYRRPDRPNVRKVGDRVVPEAVYRAIFEYDFLFNCVPVHYEVITNPEARGMVTLSDNSIVFVDYFGFIDAVLDLLVDNKKPPDSIFGLSSDVVEVLRFWETREDPTDLYSPKIEIRVPIWNGPRTSSSTLSPKVSKVAEGLWRAAKLGVRAATSIQPQAIVDVAPPVEASVPAELSPLRTRPVELGLRITFRQHWQHVGNQFGPPLRTIPLGPGQSEKISIKLTRREKIVNTQERTDSRETTTETSYTAKDTSQIVQEAAKTSQWKIDQKMQGGFNCGLWNAGGSTDIGLAEESKASSREAKEAVAESMSKATSKIRNETKVSVSREQEATFESQQSSEIKNTNDEVAVTYLYQLLQKQYLLTTYLAEVSPVVLVPEELPQKINFAWVRQHGRVIESVLLDELFREVLAAIRTDPGFIEETDSDPAYTAMAGVVSNASKALGATNATTGSFGTTFEGLFSTFGTLAENRARRLELKRKLEFMAQQLLDHITANLLYYMRAIWSAEDRDARALRLENIEVPTSFRFVVKEDRGDKLVGEWEVDGEDGVKLSDLIDHTGPIGFRGNQAVYAVRDVPAAGKLSELYAYHRLAFSRPPRLISSSANPEIRIHWPFVVVPGRYVVQVEPGRMLAIYRLSPRGEKERISEVLYTPYTEAISSDHFFALTVKAPEPKVGSAFEVTVLPPALVDPELLEIERDHALPAAGSVAEAALFTRSVVHDMFWILPGLHAMVGEALGLEESGEEDWRTTGASWNDVPEAARAILREYYHEFLLRQRNQRFILIDTNSVVLNLFTGTESALETFKRAHRLLDVLLAESEVERRWRLIGEGDFSDPNIETSVRVEGIDAMIPRPPSP